jgi:mRNA-degrading endonuclease RelE of RelBE toxin-antitoxin system
MFRIRIGSYRVLYAVFEEEHLVKILLVAKRDEQTYRNLNR